MKAHYFKRFKFIPLLIAAVFFSSAFASVAHADISNWQRGASFIPRSSSSFMEESFKLTLQNLKNDNANHVSLVIPIYQSNIYSSDIHTGSNTPSDESLLKAIQYAHSLGLKVTLKPHIESDDGQWRANIDPSDRALWFRTYGSYMKRYATLGEAYGADQFIIGTELIKLAANDYNPQNTSSWRSLISEIRSIYSGSLTYAANWGPHGDWSDEKNRIAFWDLLDVVGIDAYYPLGTDYNNNSVEYFRSEWAKIDKNDIEPFSRKVNKPIIFTELGYRSTTGAHVEPSHYLRTDGVNMAEQSNLYQAMFEYWNDKSYIGGMHIWNWEVDPYAGGYQDVNYTPQNKPAEDIMRNWFGFIGKASYGDSYANNFNSTTSVNPSNLDLGNNVSINTTVSNSRGETNSTLTDIEIYDSSGNRVYQYFANNQSFSSPNSQTISTTWKPINVGTYTIKTGVFSRDWSKNYLWQENAGQFVVNHSTNPTAPSEPPQTTGIDIWWPTNLARVSGTLPLKALLNGYNVSNYEMYWQVDGGGLVRMYNSDVDYPHKEAWIDVSGWNWKSSKQYVLNFVAKDLFGRFLSERPSMIQVDN
jgi:hypothetical protein